MLRNDMYDRPLLTTWSKGRVTCWAMPPNLGQRGCQDLLEDAVVPPAYVRLTVSSGPFSLSGGTPPASQPSGDTLAPVGALSSIPVTSPVGDAILSSDFCPHPCDSNNLSRLLPTRCETREAT